NSSESHWLPTTFAHPPELCDPIRRGSMTTKHVDISRRGLLKLTGAAVALTATPAHSALAARRSTAELFFTETGAGDNLMLLHGWTCDSNDWSWQLPILESRYRVVAVDLRGHGWSEVMPSGAYDPDDYVRDIESLITAHYPDQTFVLMGHSMGGQIAARLAAKRPDLVKAVVSVDGSLGFSDKTGSAFAKVARSLQVEDPAMVSPAVVEQVYAKAAGAG